MNIAAFLSDNATCKQPPINKTSSESFQEFLNLSNIVPLLATFFFNILLTIYL
jgi:hypothetical protein